MGSECYTMPRQVTRTYGKMRETPTASRAFDDIFSDKINKPTAARATMHKWGKTSFTSVRGARETAFDLKRKLESNKRVNQDPFTFEQEEGPSSPRKRRTQGSGITTVMTPAVTRQVLKEYKLGISNETRSKKGNKMPELSKSGSDDDEIKLIKKPLKTYSRSLANQYSINTPAKSSEKTAEEEDDDVAVKADVDDVDNDPPTLTQIPTSQTSTGSTLHSTSSALNSDDEGKDSRTADQSDKDDDNDDFVSFGVQALKSDYSNERLSTGSSQSNSQPSSSQHSSCRSMPSRDSSLHTASEKLSLSNWEQRNKYQTKAVFKSPAKTIQNPSRHETLTIIRVSPPSWFKKGSRESQESDTGEAERPLLKEIITPTEDQLKYEIQTFKKVPTKDGSFDFIVASETEVKPLQRRPLLRKTLRRKFFKSRNTGVAEEEEGQDSDGMQDEEVPSLHRDVGGEQSDSQNSISQSNGDCESETNDSEPEMPKLSPAPQMEDQGSEVKGEDAIIISESSQENNNKSEENDEPPVLRTYSRLRQKPARFESKEPKKFFKSKNSSRSERTRQHQEALQKKIFTSPKKSPSKAMYNPRPWKMDDDEDQNKQHTWHKPAPVKKTATQSSVFDDEFDDGDPTEVAKPKLLRTVVWPKQAGDEAFTSLHVNREHKELFTVVQNVKQAHECQEIGETQEFMDDVEYLLAGLRDCEPVSVRCLSCVSLAAKCTMASFRMHLRAHGIVAKVFCALHDAYTDPSLSLCVAMIMFMLSRDRLNMDLDRASLDLLLKLLGVEHEDEEGLTPSKMSSAAAKELRRTKDRVRELIESLQKEGAAKQFDLETISTGNLAMESLLSLTSRKTGEVFKEELRMLGALDHIVDTVCHCTTAMKTYAEEGLTDLTVEYFLKAERCLRVLEQVTFSNTDNQAHLISYEKGALMNAMCRGLSVCEQCLGSYPVDVDLETLKMNKDSIGWAVYSCMLAILRVLLNLTHENEWGCTKIGEQEGFLSLVLSCILRSPQNVPPDTRFDLLVLGLGTLINSVEYCDINRRLLLHIETITSFECQEPARTVGAIQALLGLFKLKEEAARRAEAPRSPESKGPSGDGGSSDPNQSGTWQETNSGLEWIVLSSEKEGDKKDCKDERSLAKLEVDDLGGQQNSQEEDEYFTKALHKAGKHMEDSIVAAYVALLIGCVIQDNQDFVEKVREHLTNGGFGTMIRVLKKFLGFMNLTTAISTTGGKSILRVIEILEAC